MKKQTGLLVIILFANLLSAQLITSTPAYPTENDSIVIFFDATRGDSGLMNYADLDVYAHTGVITEFSVQSSDWKYVVAPWNVNKDKAKLTKVDDNLWKLSIGYLHEYYGVPAGEKILKLVFVFRNGDGSVTGRDVGGADIFYDLFEPGLTVFFEEPDVNLSFGDPRRSPLFLDSGDSLTITGKAVTLGSEVSAISLQYEGNILAQVADSILNYRLSGDLLHSGINELLLIAVDTTDIRDTSSLVIVRNPPVQDTALPPGAGPGINIVNENSVTLALFAPYKEFVYVIGDFNDWQVDTSYFMNRYYVSEDSIVWWLEIENLNPDTEYAFQYLVDGEIRIADPYTEKVLDPRNDKYINKDYYIYPNLKAYPDGKTKDIVGTFQTVTPDYAWMAENYQRPGKHKLVIYELLLRDFLRQHDFSTLIDTLDYLDNLGINAIELMPFNEFEGNSSWGYNPSFYFAVDKYYGPANDLKKFIDECHRRGIAVIMDIVLNHSYGQSPLVRLYDHGDHTTSPENPWYNEEHSFTNPDAQWGYDFDHESPATQYFVDRVNRYWITEYKIDGFRFDFTKGFTNDIKDSADDPWGSRYDADRVRLLKRMADRIWATDSSVYVILEHLAVNQEEEELADYGMMLWGNTHWNYCQASMGFQNDSDFSWGYYKTRGWNEPNLVTYMESHDEERLMYKNLTWGNCHKDQYNQCIGDYTITDLSTALNRIKLVSAFFYTLPGPKMIWQFGELGYDYSINYDGRLGEKPVRWDYLTEPVRLNLYKTVQALLKLRNENDVFTNKGTSVQLSLTGNGKRIAMTGSMNVLIIGNFGVTNLDIVPNFQYGGIWYDYFSGDSIYVQFTTDLIPLAPGEFHIYTDRKLETPEQDILNDIDNELPDLPEKYALYPNYPNPFNAETTLRYDLERDSDVRITIYDLTGREVYTQDYFRRPAGRYSFVWSGANHAGQMLHSGVYFIVLQRENDRLIQKITLLK
ncbi:MAG TPA: alpha-amylase [Candidatus Marinimicrobia bacterium]|nr:alpha-amylase [Candidatus Neomarinimicrobiota bacterium]